ARSGEQRIEAMQAEVTFAMRSVEELKQGLTSAGQAAVIARREAGEAKKAAQNAGESGVHEVFQQLIVAARGGGPTHAQARRPAPRKKAEVRKREPRHGFDDAATPIAVVGLDGMFRELNPAFARLVGYQEHEFGKAAWPSPHD